MWLVSRLFAGLRGLFVGLVALVAKLTALALYSCNSRSVAICSFLLGVLRSAGLSPCCATAWGTCAPDGVANRAHCPAPAVGW